MEAMASTSGSGFRFHPSDESLVVNFLLPRNLSNEVTESSSIIDDYPYRIERWNLLVAHEKDVEEGAYFLVKKAKLSSKGLRRKRTVNDADKILGTRRADKILGMWRIQHSNTDWAPADMAVGWGWSKTLLSYYSADDNSKTTGYVMNEYELLYDGTGGGSEGFGKGETYKYVICHVKLSDREISRRKRRKESAATSYNSTSGTSTSSSASVSPVSNPHSAPSLALPSSLWPGILPQPAAAFEAPLVAASNVDAATLATVRHEFPSDYFSSFNTLNDNDSFFFFPDLLTCIVYSLNSL